MTSIDNQSNPSTSKANESEAISTSKNPDPVGIFNLPTELIDEMFEYLDIDDMGYFAEITRGTYLEGYSRNQIRFQYEFFTLLKLISI